MTLPKVRIAKLLSHKAIIISELCNKIDQDEFDELIFFVPLDKIE